VAFGRVSMTGLSMTGRERKGAVRLLLSWPPDPESGRTQLTERRNTCSSLHQTQIQYGSKNHRCDARYDIRDVTASARTSDPGASIGRVLDRTI
jgi:hypothetical protein